MLHLAPNSGPFEQAVQLSNREEMYIRASHRVLSEGTSRPMPSHTAILAVVICSEHESLTSHPESEIEDATGLRTRAAGICGRVAYSVAPEGNSNMP